MRYFVELNICKIMVVQHGLHLLYYLLQTHYVTRTFIITIIITLKFNPLQRDGSLQDTSA